MKKANAIIVSTMMTVLAGCTDSPDSLAREYRNANNEGIDAMMMITSENSAKQMAIRVFRPLKDRYDNIDNRLKAVHNNSTNEQFITQTFQSNNVHLYLTEIEINRQRYTLEMLRLRRLLEKQMEKKLAEDPNAKAAEAFPGLYEVVVKESTLNPLITAIKQPKLVFEYMNNFPNAKNVKNYDKLHEEFAKMRRSLTFTPPDIKLID